MKKLIAVLSLFAMVNAFAVTQTALPDWVLPNTKHAAMEELKFNASHFTVLNVETEEVLLSDNYAAVEVKITFTNTYGDVYRQEAICNPIRNRLLCRYSLVDTKTLRVITESEGIFFRKE